MAPHGPRSVLDLVNSSRQNNGCSAAVSNQPCNQRAQCLTISAN